MTDSGGTLYHWRVYCNTENAFVYGYWSEDGTTGPTACPHYVEGGAAHTLEPGSATIVDRRESNVVVVSKEQGFTTNGHVKIECIPIACSLGINTTATVTKSWPYDVALNTVRLAALAASDGDLLECKIGTGAAAGVITSDVKSGDTVVRASSTAVAAADPGYGIILHQGASQQSLGYVVSRDATAGTITCSVAAGSTYTTAGAAWIELYQQPTKDYEFMGGPKETVWGNDRTTSMRIPAGVTITGIYTNKSALAAKRIIVYLHVSY